MRVRCLILVMMLIGWGAAPVALGAAATRPVAPVPSASPTAAPTAPVFSPDARWVLGLIIVVFALILAAAVIGPLYLMSLPEALPVTHSHDEPPGSSHHHGPSGTMDFAAPDRLGRQSET